MRTAIARFAAIALLAPVAVSAQAGPAIRSGFNQTQLNLGDDLSTLVNIGFTTNLSGNEQDRALVCANGYLVFGGVGTEGACATANPTINIVDKGRGEGPVFYARNLGDLVGAYGNVLAPYFADFDATVAGSGKIYSGTGTIGGAQAFAVTWNGVAAYNGSASALSYVQLVLINRGLGNFDFEYNYGSTGFAPTRIGYGDDGSFTGAGEQSLYVANGVQPASGTRIAGSFIVDANGNGLDQINSITVLATTTPEPGTVALLTTGFLGLGAAAGWRRRRAA